MLRQILQGNTETTISPAYRWGMLCFILALISCTFGIHWSRENADWAALRFSLIVPFMLLFNHLAGAFSWPRLVQRFLKILSITWTIIGFIIIVSVLING